LKFDILIIFYKKNKIIIILVKNNHIELWIKIVIKEKIMLKIFIINLNKMSSKLWSILSEWVEDNIKIDEEEKNFLKTEYKKRRQKFIVIIVIISLIILWLLWFFSYKYKNQIKVWYNRIYISLFWFSINPEDYKIEWFENLSWWWKILYLKDIKAIADANKYSPENFKIVLEKYEKMWKEFVSEKNIDKFKEKYANFWWLNYHFIQKDEPVKHNIIKNKKDNELNYNTKELNNSLGTQNQSNLNNDIYNTGNINSSNAETLNDDNDIKELENFTWDNTNNELENSWNNKIIEKNNNVDTWTNLDFLTGN